MLDAALQAIGLVCSVAIGLVGLAVVITRRQRARKEALRPEDFAVIVLDPERGYMAVCLACEKPIGEWRGGPSGGFSPPEALEAAEAERDFHLWASH